MSLNSSIGRKRIQAILKPFFFSPLLFARLFSQASTVHCKVPTNFTLNFSSKPSNLTAPSSSRGIDASCRSNVIMNFDTAKQPWLNGFGLMSIQKLFDRNIIGRHFAPSLTVLLSCWTLSMDISSDFSVTYLLIPCTIRTHETVWSLNKDSIMISIQ